MPNRLSHERLERIHHRAYRQQITRSMRRPTWNLNQVKGRFPHSLRSIRLRARPVTTDSELACKSSRSLLCDVFTIRRGAPGPRANIVGGATASCTLSPLPRPSSYDMFFRSSIASARAIAAQARPRATTCPRVSWSFSTSTAAHAANDGLPSYGPVGVARALEAAPAACTPPSLKYHSARPILTRAVIPGQCRARHQRSSRTNSRSQTASRSSRALTAGSGSRWRSRSSRRARGRCTASTCRRRLGRSGRRCASMRRRWGVRRGERGGSSMLVRT